MKAIVKILGDHEQEYLLGAVNTLGSALDNTITLQDHMVGFHHAEIRRTSDRRYEIVDLDSLHGTFVGKQRVKRQVLAEGDEIMVGASRMVFRQATADDNTRRWAERLPCDLPVRVEIAPGRIVDTRATLISLKGLQLELVTPLLPEAIIGLCISFPGRAEPIEVRARVANVRGQGNVGFAFLFHSEQTQAQLVEQVRRLMLAAQTPKDDK